MPANICNETFYFMKDEIVKRMDAETEVLRKINGSIKELTAAIKECGSPKEPNCREFADELNRAVHEALKEKKAKRQETRNRMAIEKEV